MEVAISTAVLGRILAHAAATPAVEVCGLLFGDDGHVLLCEPAENVSPAPDRRFEIDPQALFAAIRAERRGGPRLTGHYHSHPSGDVAPSPCDAAMAEPGRLWLIVGDGRAAAWRAAAGGRIHGAFEPVALRIAG